MTDRFWHYDYSKAHMNAKDAFVHEITHLWQEQNGVDLIKHAVSAYLEHNGVYADAYKYRLEEVTDFTALNIEQQASFVDDYFRWRRNLDQTRYLDNTTLTCKKIHKFEEVLKPVFTDLQPHQRCKPA